MKLNIATYSMLLTLIWKLYTKTVFGIRFWVLSPPPKLPDFFLKTCFRPRKLLKNASEKTYFREIFYGVIDEFSKRSKPFLI